MKTCVKKLDWKGKGNGIAVNVGEIAVCVCVSNMGSTLIVYVPRRKSRSRGQVYDEIKLVID